MLRLYIYYAVAAMLASLVPIAILIFKEMFLEIFISLFVVGNTQVFIIFIILKYYRNYNNSFCF